MQTIRGQRPEERSFSAALCWPDDEDKLDYASLWEESPARSGQRLSHPLSGNLQKKRVQIELRPPNFPQNRWLYPKTGPDSISSATKTIVACEVAPLGQQHLSECICDTQAHRKGGKKKGSQPNLAVFSPQIGQTTFIWARIGWLLRLPSLVLSQRNEDHVDLHASASSLSRGEGRRRWDKGGQGQRWQRFVRVLCITFASLPKKSMSFQSSLCSTWSRSRICLASRQLRW